jgi:hypothetical protein
MRCPAFYLAIGSAILPTIATPSFPTVEDGSIAVGHSRLVLYSPAHLSVPTLEFPVYYTGSTVGVLFLRLSEHQFANGAGHVGYHVKTNFRGQGIATSALKVFKSKVVHSFPQPLSILCAPENYSSQRVALKAGGTLIGELLRPVGSQHDSAISRRLYCYIVWSRTC